MRSMFARLAWPLVLLAVFVMAGTPAYGQAGNATTLSGVVTDSQGGVIPGADVVAKNNANNTTIEGVTDGRGRFVLAGVMPGTYTVSVSLMGFKTAVLPDVQVQTGDPGVGQGEADHRHPGGNRRRHGPDGGRAGDEPDGGHDDRGQPDSAVARDLAHRARLRGQPAGDPDQRPELPRVDDQRPADQLDQHHAGRRQRAGQARVRGHVHVHPPDDGLGRRGDRHDVERRRGVDGRGREQHPDGDARRLEPVQRVGVQHVAQPGGDERGRRAGAQESARAGCGA